MAKKLIFFLLVVFSSFPCFAGTGILTGRVLDNIGNPVVDTLYAIRFTLYAQPTGGSPFWTEDQSVRTSAGLFAVLLGSVTPIGALPDAGALYLGMKVGADPEMTPRLRIVSAAYAFKADTASYALAAPSGAGDNAWVRGAPDSVLFTVHRLGLARGGSNNALFGSFRQSHVNFGVNCTTGVSGQDYSNVTVSGGLANTARAGYSTVGGGWLNRASGVGSAVAGGVGNFAGGDYSIAAGGFADTTLALCGGVLSGYRNRAGDAAVDSCATVTGGYQNRASGKFAFVGGGHDNRATGRSSSVVGGYYNFAESALRLRPEATATQPARTSPRSVVAKRTRQPAASPQLRAVPATTPGAISLASLAVLATPLIPSYAPSVAASVTWPQATRRRSRAVTRILQTGGMRRLAADTAAEQAGSTRSPLAGTTQCWRSAGLPPTTTRQYRPATRTRPRSTARP